MKTVRRFLFLLLTALLCAGAPAAPLKVATLHPVLTEVAQAVGGKQVQVTAIVPPGTDVHHFSPTPADIRKLDGATLVLVAGKNLENYLDRLRSILRPGQEIVEVGKTIPSETIEPGDEVFLCCPDHAKGGLDPHWWNSVEAMQRAGRILAEEFAKKDPANKAAYQAGAAAWSTKLDALKKWAKKEISAIPAGKRKLATAHLSLRYFAREFGFKILPVQGLNHNAAPATQDLATAIKVIREKKIVAVFPEQGVNAKYLRQLAADTGVKIGGELVADGNGTGALAGFEAALRHNVQTIVAALK